LSTTTCAVPLARGGVDRTYTIDIELYTQTPQPRTLTQNLLQQKVPTNLALYRFAILLLS